MENVYTTYKNLTGVDIAQQERLWDERGKGYYGEFLVFSELYPQLQGACKILMNLEIPTGYGKTTEIDLLLIHETGFFVFEVKHYKGTIYGKGTDRNWTQYFRTTSNEHFYNPIVQNRNHINALARMFPGVPIHSYIVFTNPDCTVKVRDIPEGVSVCNLQDMLRDITPHLKNAPVFDMAKIDEMFGALKKYSPMLDKPVSVDGAVVPFVDYVQLLSQQCQQFVEGQEVAFLNKIRKAKRRTAMIAACVLAACIFFSVLAVTGAQKQAADITAEAEQRIAVAESTMSEFAQKFEHVAEFNDGNIQISDNLIAVSDVVLEKSPDILNAVNFSCKLTSVSSVYGISVGENAAIIVILKDGSVKEYDLWNESYPFRSRVRFGQSTLAAREGWVNLHEFYDVDVSDIAYVKLTNLGVWALNQYSNDDIATGYEIELYDAGE